MFGCSDRRLPDRYSVNEASRHLPVREHRIVSYLLLWNAYFHMPLRLSFAQVCPGGIYVQMNVERTISGSITRGRPGRDVILTRCKHPTCGNSPGSIGNWCTIRTRGADVEGGESVEVLVSSRWLMATTTLGQARQLGRVAHSSYVHLVLHTSGLLVWSFDPLATGWPRLKGTLPKRWISFLIHFSHIPHLYTHAVTGPRGGG